MKLSSSNIKKFLIFSQTKAFLIFQETEPTPPPSKKKQLIFQETETLKNFLYFRREFPARKAPLLKCFLYFRKWNFLIFQEVPCKA